MYNNEVTYHDKWDTEENKRLRDETIKFLGPRSYCRCDVPLSWAPEVNKLIKDIHSKYGIRYDLSSYYGYMYPRSLFDLLLKKPLKSLFYKTPEHMKKYYEDKPFYHRPLSNMKSFFGSYGYAFSVIKRNVIGTIYNRLFKPRVNISQVKEKFGSIRVYFGVLVDEKSNYKSNEITRPGSVSFTSKSSNEIEEEIELMIKKMEIALAKKGAYYTLESMKKWSSSTWDENDNKITKYPYKELIDGA